MDSKPKDTVVLKGAQLKMLFNMLGLIIVDYLVLLTFYQKFSKVGFNFEKRQVSKMSKGQFRGVEQQ